MKKLFLALILFFIIQVSSAQDFITTWNMSETGSAPGELHIGVVISDTCTFTWQTVVPGQSGSGLFNGNMLDITGLPTTGDIILRIAPTNFRQIRIANGPDRLRLKLIKNWGTVQWANMDSAFAGCSFVNMDQNSMSVPDLSQVHTTAYMFSDCNWNEGNGAFASWNTSNIVNMKGMFMNCKFNQNINNWDVSNVTDMSSMFCGAWSFNQPIGNWDVSGVTNMDSMFFGSMGTGNNFNQPLGNWDVSSVTSMRAMFGITKFFNQNLNSWDVSKVENMSAMFGYAYSFNHSIGNWDVGNVTDMSKMFVQAFKFNQPIGNWDVGNVTNMSRMFEEDTVFNQPIGNWNTGHVNNMNLMFYRAKNFNQPIGSWNVSNVTNMSGLFSYAWSFNQPLNAWDVSHVTNMAGMFGYAKSFNQPLGAWNTHTVNDMTSMFSRALVFNQPIDSWDVSNVTTMQAMFYVATMFNQSLNSWDVGKVTNFFEMFSSASAFNSPIGSWNPFQAHTMQGMFRNAVNFNQPLNTWDVSQVFDMGYMFNGASSFNQPLHNWNVAQVEWMGNMFLNAASFNQELGEWTFNPLVNTTSWLVGSAMDCTNWGLSLVGWAANPLCPNGITITGPQHGSAAAPAYAQLTGMKGWSIVSAFNAQCPGWNFETNWTMDSVGSPLGELHLDVITAGLCHYEWWDSISMQGSGTFSGNQLVLTGLPATGEIRLVIARDSLRQFRMAYGPDRKRLKSVLQWGKVVWSNLDSAFAGCSNMDITTGATIPVLYQVQSMASMFDGCEALTGDTLMGLWRTERVRDMARLFKGAVNFNRDISAWKTDSVEDMGEMFSGAKLFDKDIGNWNTGKVKFMGKMFFDCQSFSHSIGNWNVSQVVNMNRMLNGASAYNKPLSNWVFHPGVNTTGFLQGAGMTCISYSNSINGWASQAGQPSGIYLDAGLGYGDFAIVARSNLISTKNWLFNDYWQVCAPLVTKENNDSLRIGMFYPNPAASFCVLNIESPSGGDLTLTLLDLQGRPVLTLQSRLPQGLQRTEIPLQNLEAGLYLALISFNGQKVSRKLEIAP